MWQVPRYREEILALANVDTTIALDQASADALRLLVEQASDEVIIKVYDASGGTGPLADLAADQMQVRNLDY